MVDEPVKLTVVCFIYRIEHVCVPHTRYLVLHDVQVLVLEPGTGSNAPLAPAGMKQQEPMYL